MADQAIQHLLREHREIADVLDGYERLLAKHEPPDAWSTTDLDAMDSYVDSLEAFADRHTRKEEVLFSALERFLPYDEGPLAVLRSEHDGIRTNLRAARDTLETLIATGGSGAAAFDVFRYGRALIAVTRDHMYKEQRIFFPIIARFLPCDQDAALLEEMRSIGISGNGQARRYAV